VKKDKSQDTYQKNTLKKWDGVWCE